MGLSKIIKDNSFRTINYAENQILIQNNSINSILSMNDQSEKD